MKAHFVHRGTATVVSRGVAILAVATGFAFCAAAHAGTDRQARNVSIYVAPNGSGDTCLRLDPCSIVAAQARVRKALANTTEPVDVNVLLADGIYRLDAPLGFGPEDSGTPGHPVKWRPLDGATPVISGSVQVTGWTLVDRAKGIWRARVPDTAGTRQLYVDGHKVFVASTTPEAQHITFSAADGGYVIEPASWVQELSRKIGTANVKRMEFVFPAANGAWTQSFCRVASVSGGKVMMQQPCWWNVTHRTRFRDATGGLPAMPRDRAPAMIRNAYPFLQSGQWYLDKTKHALYYRVDEGQKMSDLDVEMPHLESLIKGAGRAGSPVHDISFTGITFAYATWLGPNSDAGFAEVQDNLRLTSGRHAPPQGMCEFSDPRGSCPFGALSREPGNISWSHAERIHLIGNTFIHLGAAGLVFDHGSKDNLVNGNIFTDISGNAIILGNTTHPHPKQGFVNKGNTITNNFIHDIGTDYPGAAAVTLFFSQGTVVSHNDIFDVPYTGISDGVIQGHVDNADHPNNSTNVNANNVISYNLIHGFMQELHDGGALYIEGRQGPGGPVPETEDQWHAYLRDGLLVKGNVAFDQGNANYTWYDDAGARWIRFRSNVEWGLGSNGGHGGCQPVGDISYIGNYGSHLIGNWACTPPAPVRVEFDDNMTLPVHPAAVDLPLAIVKKAGPVKKFRHLAASIEPQVGYVQVSSGFGKNATSMVLVAGAGFVHGSTSVSFPDGDPIPANVLNNGLLTVIAPKGVDACRVIVTTPTGSTRGACPSKPVQFWTKPLTKH